MRRGSVLVVIALLAAACGNVAENVVERVAENAMESEGGGDVDVDLDDDGGSVRIQTDEGEISIDAGSGGEVPDGFEMPVPDGGEVVGTMSFSAADGSRTSVTLEYPPSALDDLVETYEEYFDSFEGSFSSQSSDSGSQFWSWGTADGAVTAAISAYDGDDYVTLALVETTGG